MTLIYHITKQRVCETVSEEKNFKNQPFRNKNHLWWPCLLMDRDKMSILYRGPSIDAFYQISVDSAKRPIEPKLGRKHLWKVLYKDAHFVLIH
jgi:hypothetical protein